MAGGQAVIFDVRAIAVRASRVTGLLNLGGEAGKAGGVPGKKVADGGLVGRHLVYSGPEGRLVSLTFLSYDELAKAVKP
jgi:hypothetical protein